MSQPNVSTFDFCEFCNRLGKVHHVRSVVACKGCLDIIEMVLSAYNKEKKKP